MEFVNLTPHVLNVICEGEVVLSIPPSGEVARVSVKMVHNGGYDKAPGVVIPQYVAEYGDLVGMPEPDGRVFITSLVVAQKARRCDVVSPGELVRNDQGQPIGCRGLQRHA